MDKTLRMIEIERIQNVAKGFGWQIENTKEAGDVLTIEMSKRIGPAPVVTESSPTSV